MYELRRVAGRSSSFVRSFVHLCGMWKQPPLWHVETSTFVATPSAAHVGSLLIRPASPADLISPPAPPGHAGGKCDTLQYSCLGSPRPSLWAYLAVLWGKRRTDRARFPGKCAIDQGWYYSPKWQSAWGTFPSISVRLKKIGGGGQER